MQSKNNSEFCIRLSIKTECKVVSYLTNEHAGVLPIVVVVYLKYSGGNRFPCIDLWNIS